jgi:hypothetical protein
MRSAAAAMATDVHLRMREALELELRAHIDVKLEVAQRAMREYFNTKLSMAVQASASAMEEAVKRVVTDFDTSMAAMRSDVEALKTALVAGPTLSSSSQSAQLSPVPTDQEIQAAFGYRVRDSDEAEDQDENLRYAYWASQDSLAQHRRIGHYYTDAQWTNRVLKLINDFNDDDENNWRLLELNGRRPFSDVRIVKVGETLGLPERPDPLDTARRELLDWCVRHVQRYDGAIKAMHDEMRAVKQDVSDISFMQRMNIRTSSSSRADPVLIDGHSHRRHHRVPVL